jgi:hypothetical protein
LRAPARLGSDARFVRQRESGRVQDKPLAPRWTGSRRKGEEGTGSRRALTTSGARWQRSFGRRPRRGRARPRGPPRIG